MKIIYSIIIGIFLCGFIHAQSDWQRIIETKVPKNLPIPANLFQIGNYALDANSKLVKEKIEVQNLVTRSDGKILVEVEFGVLGEDKINTKILKSLGLELNVHWKNRADGWLDANQILAFAESLPPNHRMLSVTYPDENNQGPGEMNSDGYRDGGKNGTGKRIAVIDNGFTGLTAAGNSGVAPSSFTSADYSGNGLQTGSVHGTACVEVVWDHAPGASYYIYKTLSGTQFGNAVDAAIAANVDVITCSLGPHNTGWDDNSGPYNNAVLDAVNAGMLFFTTAGNETSVHYQNNFQDPDNDKWHSWGTGDERNYMTVAASNPNNSNDRITAWLQWDGSETNDDYDLYLYNAAGTVLASSNSATGFESLSWTNPSSQSASVYLGLYHYEGGTPEFELFTTRGLENAMPESSIECPSNVTYSNAISVGAVHRNNYGDAPGTDPIAGYSSHGPTNSGNQAPDISSLSNSTTVAYNGDFSGTSCAAPNAAGAAIALWSSLPNYSATGIRQLIFRKAALAKDWGDSGIDYVHGHGGMFLYEYNSRNVYIYRSAGNAAGNNQRAYYNMEQANANAPSNSNFIFLGQTYPAPPSNSNLINKRGLYRSYISNATVE